jgi:hypothetical protein
VEATIGDAYTVLSDLSREEDQERVRLGITDMGPTYKEVAAGRAFAVVTASRPYKTLVLFGVNPEGFIWLLPSQQCVEQHGRMLGNKRICRWFIEHCFTLAGPKAKVLFNGVTPDGKSIINWLKKCCGARFSNTPVPTTHNGALALAFFIERPANV